MPAAQPQDKYSWTVRLAPESNFTGTLINTGVGAMVVPQSPTTLAAN